MVEDILLPILEKYWETKTIQIQFDPDTEIIWITYGLKIVNSLVSVTITELGYGLVYRPIKYIINIISSSIWQLKYYN